jgi:HSP20 family molecular chaperone IbpA
LTISWFRKKPEIYDNDVLVKNAECFWWKFVRNIILPENLDFDNIKATMENNLLIVSIKKLYFESKEIKIDRFEN